MLFSNDMTIFKKPSTDTNFNQKKTSGVRWWPQALIWQTCKTNSKTRFALKFVNVGTELNLLKLVFVSFL